jgi:uncharacterized protein YutD
MCNLTLQWGFCLFGDVEFVVSRKSKNDIQSNRQKTRRQTNDIQNTQKTKD